LACWPDPKDTGNGVKGPRGGSKQGNEEMKIIQGYQVKTSGEEADKTFFGRYFNG